MPRRLRPGAAAVLCLAGCLAGWAQLPAPEAGLRPEWRAVGAPSFEAFLASPATGPVERVWFTDGGAGLAVRTASGRYFESRESGDWRVLDAASAPEPDDRVTAAVPSVPEPGAKVRAGDGFYARLYGFGSHIYRSDDGGRSWRNVTGFHGRSIIGGGFVDLAVSPSDPDVVAVANRYGVWRSSDGGLSWAGLNETLANLPVRRLLNAPAGTRGTRILLGSGDVYEWAPGERQAWQPVDDPEHARREALGRSAAVQAGSRVTALAAGSSHDYAGTENGDIWVSLDGGGDWMLVRGGDGAPVRAVYALPEQSGVVFVALGGDASAGLDRPRVLRSLDGGLTWQNLTGDLPRGTVNGVTADPSGSAVYAATSEGVFLVLLDGISARPGRWIPMSATLPRAPAVDVALDQPGNRVYVAVDGYGIYSAPAPHRFLNVTVVNSADLSGRPAAPGSLLTVIGGRLLRAQAGLLPAPVLQAGETESQIQVPFEATGTFARLALELTRGQWTVDVPLVEVSPAIFVDREGAALILDADSGVLLDALHPARAGSRVQVLAAGLGQVTPPWPTGMAAPLREPPAVAVRVEAYLDGSPVEVTRATLAPGYVGFYLVEVQLPLLVNGGPGEIYLRAAGRRSNRVRIDLEP
ncbi:MAG: hypothetical protein IT159_00900 [Bryobacterales bacterium]|nr:hypothetical protein [Bryobacterales bacterium]